MTMGHKDKFFQVNEKLSFHNQFVIGPKYVEAFENWKRFAIEPSIFLTVHSDLNVTHIEKKDRSLTLLGL